MRIARADQLIKTDCFYIKPHVRYVMSDYEVDVLMMSTPKTTWNWSVFNSYERRYGGQDLNGKKVIIYRHNAYGDQLIASAVPRYLKTIYPDCNIHFYCHPQVRDLWEGNPFVQGGAISLPMEFDAVQNYDYHMFFEGMLEGNSERDQGNCYDDMFAWMGFDPEKVPTMYKRPHVFELPSDWTFFNTLPYRNKNFIVYHMNPDNLNRALHPETSAGFLQAFVEAYPEYHVVVVGKDSMVQKIQMGQFVPKHDRIVNLMNKTQSFRDLIPFVREARCCVVPDSSILHLAAAFDTPTVSVWGIFHPNDRARYYKNDHPIYNEKVCPHFPCRDHTFELPVEQCKDAEGHQPKVVPMFCHALESIKTHQILDQLENIL
mgnify:CR=1 FL=1